MTVKELQTRLQAGDPVRLIDVREEDEWAICHLEGAELVPLSRWETEWKKVVSGDSILRVVYCHHGIRSAHAVALLKKAGFHDVENLEGGIDAWARTIDPDMRTY
jgi:adenylyltransferase/sulfurtransferase